MDNAPKTHSGILLLLLGLLCIGIAAAGWFYFGANKSEVPTSHLILGVPYEGQYEGTILWNDASVGAYEILGYWGDTRFTREDVYNAFPPFENPEGISLAALRAFFLKSGYDAYTVPTDIETVKTFISKDIPLLVAQRLALDAPDELGTQRLLIGYSDEEQVLIFHDNGFGNNYRISYSDYEQLNADFETAALGVQPTADIGDSLDGPDTSYVYPARASIMDDEGIRRIQIKWETVNHIQQEGGDDAETTAETIRLLEEILAEDSFTMLHPAARMMLSYSLSGLYMNRLEEPERAIAILEEVTLPLIENYDFSEAFGEWKRNVGEDGYDHPFWNSEPWERLGYLYERIGDMESAAEAFQKSIEYSPENEDAQAALERVTN